MPAPAAYAHYLDGLHAQADALAEAWIDALLTALRDPAAHGLGGVDRRPIGLLMDALQTGRSGRVRELAGQLREGMHGAGVRALGEDSGAGALTGFNIDDLTLVDEDQAEKDIEISRIVQLVELKLEWELRDLQALAAALLPDARWDEDATACGPAVFARAVSQTAYAAPVDPAARVVWMRAAAPSLVTVLREFYPRLAEQLKAQGVQARGYRTVLTPSSPRAAGAGAGTGATTTTGPATTANATAAAIPPLAPQDQAVLAQWIAKLPLLSAAANPGPGVSPEFAGFKLMPMGDAPETPSATVTHELLGRVFAHILSDPRVEPPIREALGRLQGSVASLAQQDPGILASEQHPAWTLINQIAAHASELPTEPGPRSEAFQRFVQPLTTRIAERVHEQGASRFDYEQALTEMQGFIEQDQAAQLEQAAPARQALAQAEEKARLVPLLRQQVDLQLERASKLSLVLEDFLRGPWVDMLAQVMASQGADDPETQALIGTADELLASLHRPETPEEGAALRAKLPGLIDKVQRGMALINLPQPQREQVLTDLMHTHRRLFMERRAAAEAAPEPAANEARAAAPEAQPAQEGASWAQEHPSWLHDSHLGGLPTVPMGLTDAHPATSPADWLAGLHIGQRCKLLLQGQWATATLLWRSDNGEFYMFSSKLAGGVHSMTRRALERLRSEGLATELAEQSLVQRAVSGVLQDLGQPAP